MQNALVLRAATSRRGLASKWNMCSPGRAPSSSEGLVACMASTTGAVATAAALRHQLQPSQSTKLCTAAHTNTDSARDVLKVCD